jgi:CheY-like chemotaxis protein
MTESVRLLHVEDDPEFAELTAQLLQREDSRLSVETAASAEAGLDRPAEESFDCIVSDYEMPGRRRARIPRSGQ